MEIRSVKFHRAAYSPADFPRDGRPQFAVVGRSNVGKSSLINSILANRKIARVSQTPGKTQAIHFYLINERFYIVDLPGYGYAKASKATLAAWGTLIRGYLEEAGQLRLIFLLLDSRRVPSGEDLQMVDWMKDRAVAWRAVLTKSDKLSNNQLAQSASVIAAELDIDKQQLIPFSKMTRRGVDAIWRDIDAELQHQDAGKAGAVRNSWKTKS